MSAPRIDLVDESGAFAPGEAVDGVVSWSLDDMPREVAVALVWSTEGKGTRDTAVVESHRIDDAEAVDSRPFTLILPQTPWSFSGTLITVSWAIELKVQPQRGKPVVERRAIVVSPTGAEIDLTALRPDGSERGQ